MHKAAMDSGRTDPLTAVSADVGEDGVADGLRKVQGGPLRPTSRPMESGWSSSLLEKSRRTYLSSERMARASANSPTTSIRIDILAGRPTENVLQLTLIAVAGTSCG